jgi:hypothetical protein
MKLDPACAFIETPRTSLGPALRRETYDCKSNPLCDGVELANIDP